MIKEAIVKIVNKEDLTYDEAYAVMNEIMSGETTATQNAAFLAALSFIFKTRIRKSSSRSPDQLLFSLLYCIRVFTERFFTPEMPRLVF